MKTMTEEELIIHNHAIDTLKRISIDSAVLNTTNSKLEFNSALISLKNKIASRKF